MAYETGLNPVPNAGAPSNGTSQVWTLTFGSGTTTGNFKIRFDGYTTDNIAWSSTNNTLVANIDAALGALSSVNGAANVTTAVGTMTAGIGTITVTAAGDLAAEALPAMTVATQTTGGTLSIATTTAGVDATGRGRGKGALITDTTNGLLYINTGTAVAPTWTKVGTQT